MNVPTSSPTRTRRRWLWRSLIAVLVLANLAVFGILAFVWFFTDQLSSAIPTVPAAELTQIDPVPARASEPRNILVIGSDSRENLPDDFADQGSFGDFAGQRADVIMLVHVLPGEGRVQILSLPRDLRVEIPDVRTDKINAAYAISRDTMVKTVKAFTGLPVHHYMEIDFFGFAQIVDSLGGVTLDFPYPARDLKSGLQVEAGKVRLDGVQALAYVRSRNYQELRDGSWTAVEADDFGRIGRQQRLLLAILDEARRPSTIGELGDLIDALGEHVTTDGGFSGATIRNLAWELRTLTSANVEAATLPSSLATIDGISYVIADEPEAARVLAAFEDGTSMALAVEGPLHLHVLNGNGVAESAMRLADQLAEFGFTIDEIGDASRQDYPQTVLVARPGQLDRAEKVLAELGYGIVEAGDVPRLADVVVIVGLDAPNA